MNVRGYIVGLGARTPLGLNAMQTGFIYRTGMPAMRGCALVDQNGEPVTFCTAPTLDPRKTGADRATDLVLPALQEALAPLRSGLGTMRVHVVLGVDEFLAKQRSHNELAPAARLASQVQTMLRETAPQAKLQLSARGAAGIVDALPDGLDMVASHRVDALVFGAVHTDYDVERIAELDEQGRIFTPDNLDALIPGEGAAFIVVMRPDIARALQLEPLARIYSIAQGFERANPDNDVSAYEAKGLTAAIKAATKDMVDAKLKAGWAIGDLTFEMRRNAEWQSMLIRTRHVWAEPYVVESPAQRLGHQGAASLPLAMVLAAEGWRRGYAPAEYAVAFAGSDAGERAAIVLGTA